MSERTLLNELTGAVIAWFSARAERFGLRAKAIEARYILNWGGFVNTSFTITDGETSYHLKLADDEGSRSGLENWRGLHELLSQEYHAPRMLDWIEISGTGFAGPLFENIRGEPFNLIEQPNLRRGILDLLLRLHGDSNLAALLADADGRKPNCSEYFIGVYIERFDEDLCIVAENLPPFVSLTLLDWMRGETRKLESLARERSVFHLPADSPTHGDLWASNILVAPDERWYIIDWDDLALGDPALEYAIFLGPLWRNGILSSGEVESLLPANAALRERFRLCLRAYLLDQVIDTLADWVESAFAPEHQDQVRAGKELAHREALDLYRKSYA
ncbi:MAG: aminoglycoside phosphotransferase family protein [Anaerolineaceae bacterium]|nr:aminoglycoside phosphotransferase family protein [Anaerolineaceae bacterium]